MSDVNFSPVGQRLLKYLEGYRERAYADKGGKPTIGWGHTGPEVRLGMVVTREQAENYFWADVGVCAQAIEDNRLTLTQNAYDAVVCLIYNIGAYAFRTSSPCRYLQRGDYETAAKTMQDWNKCYSPRTKKLEIDPVLVRRRALEGRLLLGDIPREAQEGWRA